MQYSPLRTRYGFSLLELLVSIGVIGILAAIVIFAINPNQQLTGASDSATANHLNAILKGLDQFYVDTGRVPDQLGLPAVVGSDREICRYDQSDFDCVFNGYATLTELIPDYLADIPQDETNLSARGTGYWVRIDDNGRFHVSSPARAIALP